MFSTLKIEILQLLRHHEKALYSKMISAKGNLVCHALFWHIIAFTILYLGKDEVNDN